MQLLDSNILIYACQPEHEFLGAWLTAEDSVFTPASRMAVSADDGQTWDSGSSNLDFQFALDGTVVPEPSAVSLMLLGAAAFSWQRRKFQACRHSSFSWGKVLIPPA